LLAVTGMRSEAKLLRGRCKVIVAGSDNSTLASKIEAAVQRGTRAILSFGVAAGLQRGRKAGDCVVATEIVTARERFAADEAWLRRLLEAFPQAWSGPIAGTDTILADVAAKMALASSSKAIAADMESHIAARAAKAHGIPFAAIRVISDDADHTLPPAALNAMTPDGGIDIMRVLGAVVRRPSQISDLLVTAGDAAKAMQTLLRCRDALGPGLGGPYLG
jgi:adenosylhomocysteine nucleosidase